jgi:hypothetical protein
MGFKSSWRGLAMKKGERGRIGINISGNDFCQRDTEGKLKVAQGTEMEEEERCFKCLISTTNSWQRQDPFALQEGKKTEGKSLFGFFFKYLWFPAGVYSTRSSTSTYGIFFYSYLRIAESEENSNLPPTQLDL